MVSTFTPNIQLEEPARGDDVGTWDTPVNNNMTLLDLRSGGSVNVPLNNAPVVLSAAQYKASRIIFSSTLTGNVFVTFPTSFVGPYVVHNACTGSSAFVVVLGTTVPGGNQIGLMPGVPCDIFNDGATIWYRNLDPIGTYTDYAGSGLPGWVGACSVAPYLNCDGSTFSAVLFPQLAAILGGTTLPDSRGRFRATLNQGQNLLTAAGGGLDGNTIFAHGGIEGVTLTAAEIPTINSGGTTVTNQLTLTAPVTGFGITAFSANSGSQVWQAFSNGASIVIQALTGTAAVISNNTGGGAHPNVPPGYIAGITMIRAG